MLVGAFELFVFQGTEEDGVGLDGDGIKGKNGRERERENNVVICMYSVKLDERK